MTPFEYLSVLFSIVMGLALANLLGAVSRLMHGRSRVRFYWPPLVWAALLFVIVIQHWWAEFSLTSVRDWTFAGFLTVLMTPVTLYLLCDLVLPHAKESEAIDLSQWYFDNRRWFFALAISLPLWSFVEEYFTRGAMGKRALDSAILGIFAVLGTIGFLTGSRRVHESLVVLTVVLIAGYIGLLFRVLPQ